MDIEKLWSDWKIDKFIGEGSFGKVYRIVREDFGHTYEAALKVIKIPQNQSEVQVIKSEGLSEDSITEYFKSMVEDIVDEFALMSKLKGNSNIVSYEDHAVVPRENEFGWEIFIRMELLTPLFDYLEQHTLTVRDVIQLGIDMCKALEVCQKYNIIHRDIKPENIFVSEIGTYKLGDFGIARQLEKTSSGLSKKGTYTYMAPEVYKGLDYNSTVDIYSLGIVLYRFLNNNRAPFMPPAPQQIRYSDKENANILRLSGKEMPKPCNAEGRLAEIVLKACAYDPKERYESPYAMRQELQTVLYSEAEKKLIYPQGDSLKNEKHEYATGSKPVNDLHLKNESESESEEKREATISLFQSMEKEKALKAEEERKKQEEEQRQKEEEERKKQEEAQRQKEEEERKKQEEAQKQKEEEERIRREKEQRRKEEAERNKAERKQHKYEKKQQNKQNTKKRVIIITCAVVVGAIFAAVLLSSQAKVTVPDLKYMNVEEANKLLEENNLKIEKNYEAAEGVDVGLIMSQEEMAGTEVKKNSTIHVVVCGETLITVPDFVGLKLEDAFNVLDELLLIEEVVEIYSEEQPAGYIISQDPVSGSKIEVDQSIVLVVSKGSELITVPDVKEMNVDSAKKKLTDLGLEVSIEKAYSESVKKDKVVKQSVSADKQVKKNTEIVITVSKGEKPVETTKQIVQPNTNTNTQRTPVQQTEKQTKKQTEDSDEDSLDDWELIN